jgi:hypothetical protein
VKTAECGTGGLLSETGDDALGEPEVANALKESQLVKWESVSF